MMNESVLDVDVNIQGSDEVQTGKLYLRNEKSYLYLNSNPFGAFNNRSIPVAYITDHKSRKLYTAVQCYWRKEEDRLGCQYDVEELYEDGHIGNSTSRVFKGVRCKVSHLTHWLNPKLFNSQRTQE